jgi:signal transduction histidine kinase
MNPAQIPPDATSSLKQIGEGLVAVLFILWLSGCAPQPVNNGPTITFTTIPRADQGGPIKIATIEGRVTNAGPGQRIVLYARSGAWYVQPYADQPFTKIESESTWTSPTHLGTDYAALLVNPEYQPPVRIEALPAPDDTVVAVVSTPGEPVFWQTRWFRLLCALLGVLAIVFFYRLRMLQFTRQLNVRFEERLAERMHIAQELHDTLLQGVVSVSMQLHVAVEQLPPGSPAKSQLDRILQVMANVTEEGRNTLRGLRSSQSGPQDLEQAFCLIQQELGLHQETDFRVIVEGTSRPLQPVIRNEVYRIGREALANAFHHSHGSSIEMELEYAAKQFRMLVRDNGRGIDPQVQSSGREGHWGLEGMRERAERIGAKLKVWSRVATGTEVELTIPNRVAFEPALSTRSTKWFTRFYPRPLMHSIEPGRNRNHE